MNNSIFIIIPAFNEGAVIFDVVTTVRTLFPNVVVVDDFSTDSTGGLARCAGAIVLRHPFNMGQGAALQTGIEYATRKDAKFIVTFDADGQHDINDVPQMLEKIETSGADLVLGSRFIGKTERLPFMRKLILKAAVVFTAVTSGLTLTDTHNGLRVMRGKAAAQIKLRQNRMAHASEILDQIAELKLKYIEAPVTVRYTEYSLTKGQRLTGVFAILADIFYGKISK